MAFVKAQRKQAFLKLALTGPSGSGKSLSALFIARGLVGPTGRIAGIDTENGSLSLYSDRVDFDVTEIEPPFTVAKYTAAIDEAAKARFDVLVIDSLTHAWAGEGGLLDKKEALDSGGRGNGYTNWAKITKEHELLKSKILQANLHVIVTMRSKQDYALVDEKGKQVPKKIGMAPIQRDGMEYEFTTVFDMDMSHNAMTSKDRSGIFDGAVFVPTQETGEALARWLEGQPAGVAAAKQARRRSSPSKASQAEGSQVAPAGKPFDMNFLRTPENYVPRFGKFDGKRLGDRNPGEIQHYLDWLKAEYEKTKKMTPECAEFVRVAMAYVAKHPPKQQEPEDDIPDFEPQEGNV
ncbi:MAG: AAA family ATPase [Calothrix sp. SM1_5_4]|nr:AAA family ATPase [Calothrix sp. SM1_5_4]